jgi:hypothetical protein
MLPLLLVLEKLMRLQVILPLPLAAHASEPAVARHGAALMQVGHDVAATVQAADPRLSIPEISHHCRRRRRRRVSLAPIPSPTCAQHVCACSPQRALCVRIGTRPMSGARARGPGQDRAPGRQGRRRSRRRRRWRARWRKAPRG